MITLKNIFKSYIDKKKKSTSVLENINLQFDEKGLVFILGKSGSGKSTLLNIIGGLDKYDSGEIIVQGNSTINFKEKDFDYYRNSYVGFIFQEFNLIEDYTIYENIILSLELQNQKITENELDNLLKRLEIIELKNRKISQLSGGQKQRVAIARALIKKPKIILADEPTGNLDSNTGIQVMQLLKEISKDTIVIVVSHNVEYANDYADRVIEISDGKIIRDSNNEFHENNTNEKAYSIVKAKLPVKEALKLGFISLYNKKIKLFITILLITFSTIFLAISFIISSYSLSKIFLKTIEENKINVFEIKKYSFNNDGKELSNLYNDDAQEIENMLNQESFRVYSLSGEGSTDEFFKMNINESEDILDKSASKNNDLYTVYASKIQIIESELEDNLIDEDIIGSFPKHNDQIVISSYLADLFIKNGIYEYNSDDIYYPKDYEDLINSDIEINFGSNNYAKIVGIINYDLADYKNLVGQYQSSNSSDLNVLNEASKLRDLINNVYNKVYVKSGFLSNLKSSESLSLDNENIYKYDIGNGLDNKRLVNAINNRKVEYYNGTSWEKTSTLNSDEVIIPIYYFFTNEEKTKYDSDLNIFLQSHPYGDKYELEKEFIVKNYDLSKYIGQTINLKVYENTSSYIEANFKEPSASFDNLKIIGVFGLVNSEEFYPCLFSNDILGKYIDNYFKLDSILVKSNSITNIKSLINKFPYNSQYALSSTFYSDLENYYFHVKSFKIYANIAGVVFFLFSLLLICNFMFSSISSRKKDIGILKSLGATKLDVIKIFILEGITLSIISSIICTIALYFIMILLNNTVMQTSSIPISPFYLNASLVSLVFIYTVVVVLISSIIPLTKIFKMKPIDAIYNR